jgi:exodeoxyribonuclease V gamma subunit
MALKLIVNEKTDVLFEKFYQSYKRAWVNPFAAPALLVPNPFVNKWLKITWAQKSGVVCGLEGIFLEKFFWNFLCNSTGETRKIIHAEEVTQWILDFWPEIEADALSDGLLKPLVEYVEGDPVKKVQIAVKMARLLLEYELSRPAMGWYEGEANSTSTFKKGLPGILENWGTPNTTTDTSETNCFFIKSGNTTSNLNQKITTLEPWQKELYQRLFVTTKEGDIQRKSWQQQIEERESVDSSPIQYSTLARWLQELRVSTKREAVLKGFADKHKSLFFWSTGLSLFHRQLLMDIASYADVYVYQLNPCAEFWEDVDTSKGRKKIRSKLIKKEYTEGDGFKAFTPFTLNSQAKWGHWADQDWSPESEETSSWDITQSNQGTSNQIPENKLLQSWGHIGKENIALWSQMVNYDFDNCLDQELLEPASDNMLSSVKDLILNRSSELEDKITYDPTSPDESIVLVEAPGLRREVEALRAHILMFLKKNPNINLNEIGVFAPDPAKYRPYFEQVFHAVSKNDPFYLPFQYVDETIGESDFFKGLLTFMDLIEDGRFDRLKIFEYLRNPIVMNSQGYNFETLKIWENWAAATNAYTGYNIQSRSSLGEVNADPWHSFRYALDRMLLDGVVNDDFEKVSVYGDRFSSDAKTLGLFVQIIENLWSDIYQIREHLLKDVVSNLWIDKVELFRSTTMKWLNPAIKSKQMWSYSMDKRLEAESGMSRQFYNLLKPIESRTGAFDYKELFFILKSGLDAELDPKKSLFTGELMIMTLKDGRPMPWKASFVIGMGEGEFPGVSRPDPLDLRMLSIRPGDSHPVRQAKYAFLELLMCTSKHLFVSWNSRNLAKDAELMPGSVVLELEDFIRQGILDGASSKEKIKKEGSDNKFPNPNYWSRLQYSIQIEEDDLDCRDSDDNGYCPEVRTIILQSSSDDSKDKVEDLIKKTKLIDSRNKNVITDYRWLKAFLQDPLEATLSRSLNMWDNEEGDTTQVSDEPLEWNPLDRGIFNNEIISTWLRQVQLNIEDTNQEYDISTIFTEDKIENWNTIFEQTWREYSLRGKCPSGRASDIVKASIHQKLEGVFNELKVWTLNQSRAWKLSWKPETSLSIDIKHMPQSIAQIVQTEGVCQIKILKFSASSVTGDKLLEQYLIGGMFAENYFSHLDKDQCSTVQVSVEWIGQPGKTGVYQIGEWTSENSNSLKTLLTQVNDPRYHYHQIPFASITDENHINEKKLSVKVKNIDEIQEWCEDQLDSYGDNSKWYPKEVSTLIANQRRKYSLEQPEDWDEILKNRFAGVVKNGE